MSSSSMDDLYQEMGVFLEALIEFNQRLSASMRDLQTHHDYVSPHWQDDEMRRHYDAQWQPLNEMTKRYVAAEGPSYVEFLSIKHYALGRYLNGG